MATYMAIGAHPDDIEIGTGAVLHKLIRQGHRVVGVDLTDGEPTPRGTHESRPVETARANKILGITERVCLDLPNRVLMDTEEARMKLATLMRKYRPDRIFSHAEKDAHPDHVAAFHITRGATLLSRVVKIDLAHEPWRPGRIFYYLCSHLKLVFHPDVIIELTAEDYEAKLAAVSAYETQFDLPMIQTHLKSIMHYYGNLIRCPYGEPYQSNEPVGLRDFEAIV